MDIPIKIRRRVSEFDRMIPVYADAMYIRGMEKEDFIFRVSHHITCHMLTEHFHPMDEFDKKTTDENSPYIMKHYRNVLEKLWKEYKNGSAN